MKTLKTTRSFLDNSVRLIKFDLHKRKCEDSGETLLISRLSHNPEGRLIDAYPQPPPYMRPPSGPPPPADPYHQYYQHQARPPMPPPTQSGGPAWYSNQFHNPHSPSPPPPPPQQWGPPSAYPPYPTHSHQQPFNPGANDSSQFPPPSGPPPRQPYHHPNQEWRNPNWGSQQGHTYQANSNVEDWAVKAKEWAALNEDHHSQSATNPPRGQVYQQYPNHGYQDVHQLAAPGSSYQQFPAPQTTQPEIYPNYATGNESFPGGSAAGLSHQENLPTSSAIHQQEVPYSYSSVAGKEESSNATQHELQISVPDGGGHVRVEHQMQYAYGDQTAAPPSNFSDHPLQFATRESSDYASHHNAWLPHAATGVVYPPIPSSVPPLPLHNSSMAIPPVTVHTMPPVSGHTIPPPHLPPVGLPYAFGTKPPLHPGAAFVEDSYAAASSVPLKKASVLPNWLVEEVLKNKPSLGRPSSGSFEERESMDDDVHYKPPEKVDQRADKRFSRSKSSDDEEEDDEDEMDAARNAAINSEIKRILTEVLLKVTDELFDEIATKVINEDEAMRKDDSVQHNPKSSSSLLLAADPMHKASAKILVSAPDVLGLASYASDDDDDADTDAASNAHADGSDRVESLGMGLRNDVSLQPSVEKLPEPKAMVNARLDPEVEVGDISPKNNKSGLDQMLGSRRNDDVGGCNKKKDSSKCGLDVDTSGSRTNHPDRTDGDKDAILDEPHRKNCGLKSDCIQDSNKISGKDLSDDLSRDRSRTDETKTGMEKVDSQNGSKDRMKQNDIKSAEKVKGFESNKKCTDVLVKKDSRDAERPDRKSSKEDRGRGREKEKEREEERSRRRHAQDSSKDKRRRSPTSNGSYDDSIRKSSWRRRNVSPSPVRSRRKRSSPSSDESSDDSRRKSSSRKRNLSPSPVRSKKRHVSSRSPHSKHSEYKHTLHSSHEKSRSKRSGSKSPGRRHRD